MTLKSGWGDARHFAPARLIKYVFFLRIVGCRAKSDDFRHVRGGKYISRCLAAVCDFTANNLEIFMSLLMSTWLVSS